MKALVYDLRDGTVSKEFVSRLRRLFDEVSFVYAKKEFDGTLKPKDIADVDVLVTKILDNYSPKLFSKADCLKFIASMHIDVSVYPLRYLRSRGIAVSNAKGYCTEAVAELAIAAMLDVIRRTHEAMKQVERGDWSFTKLRSRELKGKTLGIIGYGNIGRRVAEIARCFGMRVEYYSRSEKTLGLNALLKLSDIISVHCPLNAETKGLLDKKKLALLKDGVVFVNTARPEICDVKEVISLAKKKKIKVYFDELQDEKLRKKALEAGIFLTPDYGWMTEEAQKNLEEITLANINAFLEGKPRNVVN